MFSTFYLAWLLSLLFPTTAPAASQATPPAPKVAWSPDRPLVWDDFKARPNIDRLAALTSSTIDANIACVDYHFSGEVRAVFTPSESWVRNAARPRRRCCATSSCTST